MTIEGFLFLVFLLIGFIIIGVRAYLRKKYGP